MIYPCGSPFYTTVTGSAQLLAHQLSSGNSYIISTNTSCFIKQGGDNSVIASAADGSTLVPAGSTWVIHGDQGVYVSIIRDTADGKATIIPIRVS